MFFFIIYENPIIELIGKNWVDSKNATVDLSSLWCNGAAIVNNLVQGS